MKNGIATTLKRNPFGTICIYNHDALIATASKQECGWYLVCIYGGKYHGKITYAQDFETLNKKGVEIAEELF